MLKRILGLVGWLGVALVFAAVAIRFLKPEYQQYYNGLAIAGLVCTLLYMLSQWREIGQAMSGRQARFGTLAAASVAVVLGILVAINYIGNKYNKRWDLTSSQQFSLSDQTKKILKDLKEPINVRVFTRSDEFQRFRDRLDQYTYQTKFLNVEYIDPEKRPGVAQQYGVTQLGTIVFDYKGRNEKVTSDSEQDVTNGLIKVIQGRQPKVYFTVGHGEHDTAGADAGGYNAISSALTSSNFVVDKIALAQVKDVPADAEVVIVAGPKTDFLAPEIEMLKAYLGRGGKLFLMLDPVLKADAPQPTALIALLKDWGIEAGNDIILDVSGMGRLFGTDESVPVAVSYPPHPISDNGNFRIMTAYPLARSMSPVEGGVNGHNAQRVVETSQNSWAETDIKGLTGKEPPKFDAADKRGPVSLAAAVTGPAVDAPKDAAPKDGEEPKKTEARLVAFGDSDFASNGVIGLQGNRELFLNAVNWLAQQENLIAIRPRDPQDQRISLTADQQRRILYLTVFIVPGLILLAGIQTWWRRR